MAYGQLMSYVQMLYKETKLIKNIKIIKIKESLPRKDQDNIFS